MFRKILSGVLLCFTATAGFSQAENEGNIRELLKIPSPPSPNAAALGKFGEIPVGLATGIPTISVPMFSWKDELKEMHFEVSLSYHAGGHMVEDMASNVGLGWALNAGGVVSRTVRGIPDDGWGGYLNTAALPSHFISHTAHISDPPPSPSVGLTQSNNASSYLIAKNITDRSHDGESDIWNLNAGKHSARFFLDKNGAVNFLTQSNLNVTYTRTPPGSISKFTLVDDRAITYIFDVTEATESVPLEIIPGQISNGCTTGFYMSKIISADKKDTIFLNYTGGGNIYYEGGFSESYRYTYINGTYQTDPTWTYSDIHTYGAVRISSIQFPDATQVSFAYTFARADYIGDNALTSVTVSNGSNSKKYNLSYEYFTSASDPAAPTMPFSPNDYSKRLKLTQVQEISGTDSLPPYIFTYNSQGLPPRSSKSQDFWGYYGGGASSSLATVINAPPGSNAPPSIGVANRGSVEQYAKAAVLEQMTYPTGGYTKFNYQSNKAQMSAASLPASGGSGLDETQVGVYFSMPMNNRDNANVEVTYQLTNNLPLPEMEPWDGDCACSVTIKSTDNAVTQTIPSVYYTAVNGINQVVSLPLGKTYQVKFDTDCMWWLQDFSVSIIWEYTTPPGDVSVGGLRVSSTEDDDGLGNKVIANYSYLTPFSTSSAILQNIPNYAYHLSTTKDYGNGDVKHHWSVTSTPSQTLLFFRGSPVIYNRVKVNKSTVSTNIGYTIHRFTANSGNFFDGSFPFMQLMDVDYSQGLPLFDSTFNSSDQLVKQVKKEYQIFSYGADSAKWRQMIAGLIFNDAASTPSFYTYAAKSYPMGYGRAELIKNTETLYANGEEIKTITEYTYDPNKFLTTKEKTFNSVGEEIETRLYYPHNYSISTDERLSSIIAKETYLKQGATWYLTGATTNEFATFNSSFIKTKKINAAELVSQLSEATVGTFNPAVLVRHASFKDQVEFLSYDTKGRFTEVKTMSKPMTSMIWCSTKNYPMAVVQDGSLVNCAYSSFETPDFGNWSGIVNANAQIGISATGNQYYQQTGFSISKSGLTSGTYYIVTYWSKNGAYSVSGTQAGYPKTLRTIGSGGDTWTLYEHLITGQTTITVSGTGSLDELRLYPRGSQMISYTFKPLAGISAQCDAANNLTYYEYDGFGRLILVRDHNRNILKKFEYKYKQSVQ